MGTGALIIIEVFLVLGSTLVFGFWQLYSLRRDKKRDEAKVKRDEPPAPPG